MAAEQKKDLTADQLIINDHNLVKELLAKVDAAENPKAGLPFLQKAMKELTVHSIIEEQLFYPCLRFLLEEGDKLADESIQETILVTKDEEKLLNLSPEDPTFLDIYKHFKKNVIEHQEKEENEILPLAKKAMEEEDLIEMGRLILKLKEIDPDTPDSTMPQQPPENLKIGNKDLSFVAEFLEKAKSKYGAKLGKRKGGVSDTKEEEPIEKRTRGQEAKKTEEGVTAQ